MKKVNNLDLEPRLLEYFNLESIDEFYNQKIDHELICKVANFLIESGEKLTFQKVSEILNINRASIYNTHGLASEYIKSLIIQQKASKQSALVNKKGFKLAKKPSSKNTEHTTLDTEKYEKFMSVIMSLEYQKQCQNRLIDQLKSEINSLKSTIKELKLQNQ
ncbi:MULTISPECIES: hypothetical protein [Acinetobacter]|uniref:hypothetical protein n=1 Tax=Acinetobacter indicus TaxID=756892 RepID=UPI0013636853|nr:hypothetical protein [Acinetobacter indicus]